MSDDFLSRWSRRKTAVRKGEIPAEPQTQGPPETAPPAPTAGEVAATTPEPLPPIESLTPESDFAPFMKPDVEPGLRREALKVLLRDPRFNVMDRLDTYIDDYSQPDPLPEGWLAQLNQMKGFTHGIEEPKEAPEAEKAPETPPAEPAETLQKGMPEQPVEPQSPDTEAAAKPGTEVGESEASTR